MIHTIAVERWCAKCQELLVATKVVGRPGSEGYVEETSCPDCSTLGQRLLGR
ncbi:MAG: hypothetical protein JOZ73_05020 [Solirubrobacterales bacterium]|nr:hypothetical protein [Solirubrobacterales bacterium]